MLLYICYVETYCGGGLDGVNWVMWTMRKSDEEYLSQVEDMLKRSFAEFHAQKNLPEKEKLLLLKLSQPAEAIE